MPAALRPHRLSLVLSAYGTTAHCGCSWIGTTMVPGPNSRGAARANYAGHLRSVREGRRQGICREAQS